MAELRVLQQPTLVRPVLIASFRGWNDGAQGATLAGSYLAKTWGAERFADIDSEAFFDFQAKSPHVSLVDGFTRRIQWPENAFDHARVEGLEQDAVLLLGVEPSLRWRTFARLITDLAKELGVELVVSLGSLLADVPHSRPAPVTGSASDPELVERLGLQASRYEGPTGIVGVLHDACRRAEIPSVSLWAAVPHYVSLTPSPRAALALCDRLGDLPGAQIDTAHHVQSVEGYVDQVSEAVAADSDTPAYVEELEQRADTLDASDLPSGDALAAELTRYLREREAEDGDDAAHE